MSDPKPVVAPVPVGKPVPPTPTTLPDTSRYPPKMPAQSDTTSNI